MQNASRNLQPVIATVLQGLQIGGMERCALNLARCARAAGYDSRLVLYDSAFDRSQEELANPEVPATFLPRKARVDFGLAARLAVLLRQWNADIVHARNQVAAIYSSAAISTMGLHAPQLLVTFDSFPGRGTTKARLACRWATRRAAAVLAVSDELAEKVVRWGWTNSCGVVWNGVDTEEFSPAGPNFGLRQKLSLAKTTLLVGQVARLQSNKGQLTLLAAGRLLRERGHDLVLVFAGDGPDRVKLQQLAASDVKVATLGNVRDVPGLLRELDIFVLCSEHEGAPLALLEAMSCAKAIVASNVGGIPAILKGSGLMLPPARPDLLAGAIESLSTSHDLRYQLGQQARARVLEFFTIQRMWKDYEEIYRRLIPNARGVAATA
jgi:L-malate glycosyltransferase